MASQVALAFQIRCGVIRIGLPFRTNPAALTVEASDRLKFVIGLAGFRPGNTYGPVCGTFKRATSNPLLRGSRRSDEAVFGVHPSLGSIMANPPCSSIASQVRLRASPLRHPVSARNAISARNRVGAASTSRAISCSVGMSTLFRPCGICRSRECSARRLFDALLEDVLQRPDLAVDRRRSAPLPQSVLLISEHPAFIEQGNRDVTQETDQWLKPVPVRIEARRSFLEGFDPGDCFSSQSLASSASVGGHGACGIAGTPAMDSRRFTSRAISTAFF